MRATGIDISKYDIRFDPTSAATPPQFVVQRASYGLRADEQFAALHPGVLKVAVRGAYHYLSSNIPWKVQAEHFVSVTSGKGFHFYVCDFENAFNVITLDFVAMAVEWMRFVRAETGQRVVIYSNPSMYHEWLARDARVKEFPLWIAQYPWTTPDPQKASPRMPASRSDWTFWQYSDHNSQGKTVGTGSQAVDLDVFNGTYDELLEWAGVSEAPLPPALPSREDCIDKLLKDHGYQWK